MSGALYLAGVMTVNRDSDQTQADYHFQPTMNR